MLKIEDRTYSDLSNYPELQSIIHLCDLLRMNTEFWIDISECAVLNIIIKCEEIGKKSKALYFYRDLSTAEFRTAILNICMNFYLSCLENYKMLKQVELPFK